jgi:hypothetical protein
MEATVSVAVDLRRVSSTQGETQVTHRNKVAFDKFVRLVRRFYYWLRDIQDAAEQRAYVAEAVEQRKEDELLEQYRRNGYTVGPRGEA